MCGWATGWNLYGQLGDGSITSMSDFIRVVKLNRVVVQDFVTVTGNVSTVTTKEAVTTLDGWLPPEWFLPPQPPPRLLTSRRRREIGYVQTWLLASVPLTQVIDIPQLIMWVLVRLL